MLKLSAAMVMTLAVACGGGGGGGGKKTDTTPMAEPGGEGTAMALGEGSKVAAEETAPKEPAKQEARTKFLKVITPEELQWTPLVAEAGDKGPMVAPLWGDMMQGPNGFMIKLPAGDKGTLHSHTNDYHGVGVTASAAWQDGGKQHTVAQGTYWFQPGGAAHANACPGKTPCLGLIEFNSGKFDFAPAKPTKGAKPDAKAVEKSLASLTWTLFDPSNPKGGAWASAWGDMQAGENGVFVKLSAGNAAFWHMHTADYHAVLLQGTSDHHESGSQGRDLPVGTYWYQPGGYKHVDLCKAGGPDCIIYAYFTGPFDAKPAQ